MELELSDEKAELRDNVRDELAERGLARRPDDQLARMTDRDQGSSR